MPHSDARRDHDRSALILYGSETGNAQDVADELARLTERLHLRTQISELNAVGLASLSDYDVVLIAVSTTGQGDLPANARTFWRSILRKRLPADYLDDVTFAIFGLGDSSYPKFNWAARKLQKRMLQLGASSICPHGEADEQHPEGTDGSFLPWLTGLRQQLLDLYPLPQGVTPIPDDVLLPPKWVLGFALDSSDGKVPSPEGEDAFPLPAKEVRDTTCNGSASDTPPASETVETDGPPSDLLPIPGSITMTLDRNTRVTPDKHWQDVRELTFTASSIVEYGPGDVLTIFPKNFPQDVEHLISMLGWNSIADKPVELKHNASVDHTKNYPPPPIQHLVPAPVTLRKLLFHHLDITAIPRRSFFSLIAHFAEDAAQKDRLLEFTNPEYIDELYDYTTRPRRSILEVLQEFTSVKFPWQWVATVLPHLRGRQFSIASGGTLKETKEENMPTPRGKIELLVAVVKYRTVIKKIRRGVCTRYLAALPTGTELNVLLHRGGLNVSQGEMKRPVVMIAPGTGVAPMRSMLWERLAWQEEKMNNGVRNAMDGDDHVGKSVLFFGCRNREADFFYAEEWQWLKTKMDLEVSAAMSRDQRQKIYVQDLVRQQAKLVHHLLHDVSGIVYICGSSGKMPQAVREALIEVFQQEGRVDRTAAEQYLATMEKEGRYKQETW